MKKLILITATLLLLPLTSFAQDAFYVSGMLGLGTVNVEGGNPDYGTELTYGVRGGLLFNDHVAAGVFIQRYADKLSSVPGSSFDASLTNIMAEVTYYFTPADENTFFISGLLGTTRGEVDCTGCTSSSDTSVGFTAGYNFMVAPNFSIAPQFNYIHIMSDPNTASMTSVMANLTLWL